ncbi:MAG: tail fiber domain-containing protein, partial [Saprospiraceae bacterium]|nr:tail fiber domain-containing protein [Saprospiraceae bacterium]
GIGVDTPQTKLHVAGTLMADSLRLPPGARHGLVLTSDSLGHGSWQPVFELTPRLAATGEIKTGQDPAEVVVSGNYAFVANNQIGEIKSYDVSGVDPVPLDTLDVPGSFSTDLTIVGDVLVARIHSSLNDSLYTIDISSPDSLFKRDALYVDDDLYIGHAAGQIIGFTTFTSNELIVFDFSNPDSIFQTGTMILDNPVDIKIVDTFACILESTLGELRIISLADPTSPYMVSSVPLIDDYPSRIVVSGSYAYITVLVDFAPDKLQIVDLSNPLAPQAVSSLTFGPQSFHFDVLEPFAFLHVISIDSLVIIDVTDKSQPFITGHAYAGPNLQGLDAEGQRIFYTEQSQDVLRILQIGPTIPMLNEDGTFSSFDGSYNGLLEIRSPSHLDHLRLNRPGIGQVDVTIGRGIANETNGLAIEVDQQTLLFGRASDGYLGIGTELPREKLHVHGGSVFAANLGINTDTNEGFLLGPSSFQPAFGLVYDGSFGEERAHLKHMTFGGDTVALMTFHENGNVGVGTGDGFFPPEVKLDVGGSIRSVGGSVSIKDALQSLTLTTNEAAHYIHLDVGGTTHSQDDIILGDLSGPSNKVGIGTSTPGSQFGSTLLDVRGGHIALANNFGVFSGNSAGTNIGAGFDTGTGDELSLYAGGVSQLRIQSDGKTGIGTTSPDRDLTVFDTDGNGDAAINFKDGVQEVFLGVNNSGGTLRTMTSHDLSLWTNNVRRMTIDTDGNIGIGTSFPEYPLHIDDTGVSGQPTITLVLESNTSNRPTLLFSENASSIDLNDGMSIEYNGAASGNELTINAVGGSPLLTVESSSGEVGIGTTNPTALLEVNAATVKKVGGGSWTASSDIRLKQDIRDYRAGLEDILRIRPVRFRYNALSGYDTSDTHVGVVAQELQEVAPDMVSSFDKDGETYLEVDNSDMIYMLVNAVQELHAQNTQLRLLNADLEKRLTTVEQIRSGVHRVIEE